MNAWWGVTRRSGCRGTMPALRCGRRKRCDGRGGRESAPRLGEARPIGMPVHQQHRELMGGQRVQRCSGGLRPPREMPAGETLEAQPETLPIVDEEFEGGASSVAKQKDGAGERVTVEPVPTQRGKGIDTFAEVDRLIGEHDVELWRELDHGSRAKQTEA